MRFSRVVDALDASGGIFCMCVCTYVVYKNFSCTSCGACCVFSAHFLVFISCLQLSLKSLLFLLLFLVSHLLLLSSISKFKQPMTYIQKGRRKRKKMRRVKYIFCWLILNLGGQISPFAHLLILSQQILTHPTPTYFMA